MTDNEIITDYREEIEKPRYLTVGIFWNVLDLINRQKAEIERLEIENRVLSQKRVNIFERLHSYQKGESEGQKKFAEKVKAINGNEFLTSWYESADICYEFNQEEFEAYIDNLLEEMESERQ